MRPVSACVDEAWCDGDQVKVGFATTNLHFGQIPWAFIAAKGSTRWYPSREPVPLGDPRWLAVLSVGPARSFRVHILVLDPMGQAATGEYLFEREEDGDWGRGMLRGCELIPTAGDRIVESLLGRSIRYCRGSSIPPVLPCSGCLSTTSLRS